MERRGLSYGEVVRTQGLRVRALLGGSKSPTSRSPEAVDWIMCVWVTEVRTLVSEEGGGLYRVRQDPGQPTLRRVQCTLRQGVTGNASNKEI